MNQHRFIISRDWKYCRGYPSRGSVQINKINKYNKLIKINKNLKLYDITQINKMRAWQLTKSEDLEAKV